jgi:hypothetical protein
VLDLGVAIVVVDRAPGYGTKSEHRDGKATMHTATTALIYMHHRFMFDETTFNGTIARSRCGLITRSILVSSTDIARENHGVE